jgi:predicted transglutaminase-like cysteine proteinase
MKFSTGLAFAAVMSLTMLDANGAMAYAPHLGVVTTQRQAIAPLGFYLFCLKNPNQCRPGGNARMAMDTNVMSILKQVNLSVNTSMRPKADAHGDAWTLGASVGDCEDYVLNKRAALIRKGLPPSALRIAYVKTAAGADHAVLVAIVGKSSLVLDNLTNEIRPLAQSGLTLISMSGATPTHWNS